jgi:hypothetical protein
MGVIEVTTFVSQQVRRATPAVSLAAPAQRVARSFAAVGTAVTRSYRAFGGASAAQRGQGFDTTDMLMHARG